MAILDAYTLESGTKLVAPVVIVGAGAAGITLARALAARGLDCLLVEGGGLRPDERTQTLHEVVAVGHPLRPGYVNRAREFGGSCNLWAGRSMRLTSFDVGLRPWVAPLAWPIPITVIESHLAEAARILELPDPSNFALEAHRARLSHAERRLLEAGPFAPTLSLWARRPKRFAKAYRRELARSKRIRVLLCANATELLLDDGGERVAGVELRSLDGRRFRAEGRIFVLACGGIEVPRLLLASRSRHPKGIGNEHDLVGRFFMDHPRAAYGRVRIRGEVDLPLMRTYPLRDGRVQLGLALPREMQEREKLLHHYLTFEEEHSSYAEAHYQTAVELGKVLFRRGHAGSRFDFAHIRRAAKVENFVYLLPPKEILPYPLWRAYRLLKDRLRPRRGERRYVVVYFCEQPPLSESRITLARERDALGMPKVLFDWRIPDSVHESLWRLQAHLEAALEKSGLGMLEPGEGIPRYTDASHHLGTARMGASPRQGVVDPDLRVWSVSNLYIASSAVFPTGGHANPTLTILALSLRLAEHLTRELGAAVPPRTVASSVA